MKEALYCRMRVVTSIRTKHQNFFERNKKNMFYSLNRFSFLFYSFLKRVCWNSTWRQSYKSLKKQNIAPKMAYNGAVLLSTPYQNSGLI